MFTKVVLLWGRHAIEGWGCRHGVCTHVPEEEPVSHPELGEGAVLQNTVQSITSWSPHTATVTPFITFLFVIMKKKSLVHWNNNFFHFTWEKKFNFYLFQFILLNIIHLQITLHKYTMLIKKYLGSLSFKTSLTQKAE